VKIGIYLTTGEGVGGADFQVAVLAEALSRRHDVEVVHHKRTLTVADLARFTATDLRRVRLRYLPPNFTHGNYGASPSRRALSGLLTTASAVNQYSQVRDRAAELSGCYDLLINCTVNLPLPCAAPRGILLVFFPWEPVTSYVIDQLWREHLDSYQHVIAISEFTRRWTRRRWGVDSEIIAPPVDTDFRLRPKTNTILTAGRFVGRGRSKRQLELVRAFSEMRSRLCGWGYVTVGGLADKRADHRYFKAVSRVAARAGAMTFANVEREPLKRLYEEAKIFWYAAGYNDDMHEHPERAEHFGIVTAEAMAAGCVPVVYNAGGQPEIVRHGVDGFVWNTLPQLQEYTARLVRDDELRRRMSQSARERAREFSCQTFVERVRRIVEAPAPVPLAAPRPPRSMASVFSFVVGRKMGRMFGDSAIAAPAVVPAIE